MQPDIVHSVRTEFPRIAGSYLVLELSNLCNLQCVHCAVSENDHPHHRSLGHLPLETVDALIEDMVRNQLHFDVLILFWLGEPLMHPQFEVIYRKFIRSIHQHQIFSSIEVHTNAILLDAKKRRLFLNQLSVPQKIHCTIDAMSADTYKAIKGRDAFEQVLHNTEALLREKVALDAQNPRIVLQYIVGSNNVEECAAFRDHWVSFGDALGKNLFVSAGQIPNGTEDGLFFRQLDCPTEEAQQRETLVFQQEMRRLGVNFPEHEPDTEIQTGIQPCSGFWKSPTIDWRGNLTSCTRDNTLENGLGNILETPFSELWWGRRQHQHRRQVANGDYTGLSLCETCFIPTSCNHSDISAMEIQQYQSQADS